MVSKQAPTMLILGRGDVPSFDVVRSFSMRHQWFICIRLSDPYLTVKTAFSVSFTTALSPD